MNKEQQAKLLTEIMEADQKNGLYDILGVEKKMTAVELLHKESNELITKYLDGKIDKRELITMHHNILYVHKEMEKEQIMKAFLEGKVNHNKDWADQYYNKTYGK